MSGILLAAGPMGLAIVTLSGETIADSDSGGATVGIHFRADGTVDKEEGAVITQIDAATDWIIPADKGSALYEIRQTGSSAFTTEPAAPDAWIDLGSDRNWEFTSAITGAHNISCDFEIRKNGGATLATGSYEFDLIVTP